MYEKLDSQPLHAVPHPTRNRTLEFYTQYVRIYMLRNCMMRLSATAVPPYYQSDHRLQLAIQYILRQLRGIEIVLYNSSI